MDGFTSASERPSRRDLTIQTRYASGLYTLKQLGDEFGVTRERVRQIVAKGVASAEPPAGWLTIAEVHERYAISARGLRQMCLAGALGWTVARGGKWLICTPDCDRVLPERQDSQEIFWARFWNRVSITSTCYVWQGALTSQGYGHIYVPGPLREPLGLHARDYAHRARWASENGPIPARKFVCHTCDNPRCVRMSHLWLGDALENARDRDRKGRGRKPGQRGRSKAA